MWVKQGNIFNEHHAQVPVVDTHSNTFRIYYSTRDESGRSIPMSIDVLKDNPAVITNPVNINLELGQPGSFDWAGVMPTDIVTLEDGTKYLYYIGWSRRLDVPYHNNLGLAISIDNGVTWSKYSNGPILHTSHKEPGYIGTVEVIIEGGIWKMWYLSCREWVKHNNIMEPTYDIKYATSKNGIDWEPTNITCIPLENQEGGISAARVIKENSLYHMWFSVRDTFDYRDNPKHSYRIKKATSTDGIVWDREQNVELDISNEPWENTMVCYPDVIYYNGLYYMFYNGNKFGQTGIGYATRETLT